MRETIAEHKLEDSRYSDYTILKEKATHKFIFDGPQGEEMVVSFDHVEYDDRTISLFVERGRRRTCVFSMERGHGRGEVGDKLIEMGVSRERVTRP